MQFRLVETEGEGSIALSRMEESMQHISRGDEHFREDPCSLSLLFGVGKCTEDLVSDGNRLIQILVRRPARERGQIATTATWSPSAVCLKPFPLLLSAFSGRRRRSS